MTRGIRFGVRLLCAGCIGWLACFAFYQVPRWQHAQATGYFGRDAAILQLTQLVGGVCQPLRDSR